MDSLGDRIKSYENITRHSLYPRTPVMIRIDGRAFHTFTKVCRCQKPFDDYLTKSMRKGALGVAFDMQGFKAAYVQSDEVTFLITDYDNFDTEGWFKYNLSKIISMSASIMTACFNDSWSGSSSFKLATFDSRAFNVPREDVANAFLWRMKDWERNSLQMYCQSLFSHKQLQRKNKEDLHEMLHSIGKNWTKDLSDEQKNGAWLLKSNNKEDANKDANLYWKYNVLPTYENVAKIIDPLIYSEEEMK